MNEEVEKVNNVQQLRLSSDVRYNCLSLATSVINCDGNLNQADILPLAQKMYEWVKKGD